MLFTYCTDWSLTVTQIAWCGYWLLMVDLFLYFYFPGLLEEIPDPDSYMNNLFASLP
jgi:hypothetical protein